VERRALRAAEVALAAALLMIPAADSAFAGEAVLQETTAPDSVDDLETPFEKGFEKEERRPPLFPRLSQRLQSLPPFLRDTSLLLHLRSYAFNRLPTFGDRQAAFAGGGWLAYQSGWWAERLSLGATLYTSQRFWGPSRFEGSLLLRPVQRSYSVLGQAFVKLRHQSHVLTVGRLDLDLPYVNRRDNRMTPQTFQGVTLRRAEARFRYSFGYLTDIKLRNSNDFISFSEAAGVGDRARRMVFGGIGFLPSEKLSFGAIDYFVRDTLNILYAEASWTRDLTDELGVRFGAQFTDQRSVGDDLLTGSSFDTRVFGGRAGASWRNAILTLSFSTTDDESAIRSPYGSYPGYLSRMQSDFNRAGEEAFGVGLSYHLGALGLESLSGFGNYTRGWDARDADTGQSLPDRDEWNLTFDWRSEAGRLRGFWLRLRGAVARVDGGDHTSGEFRIILNYEIPVL
jgi:hypothetical protein